MLTRLFINKNIIMKSPGAQAPGVRPEARRSAKRAAFCYRLPA
jgi:hypothetical protein